MITPRKRLQKVWAAMRLRCFEPTYKAFKHYGARGITVCDEWRGNSTAFVNWAFANGYRPGLEIDRRDNDGNYSPENCRFVTRKQNARNRRNTRRITWRGKTRALADWLDDPRCRHLTRSTLLRRINSGWKPARALFDPITPEERRNRRRRPKRQKLLAFPE